MDTDNLEVSSQNTPVTEALQKLVQQRRRTSLSFTLPMYVEKPISEKYADGLLRRVNDRSTHESVVIEEIGMSPNKPGSLPSFFVEVLRNDFLVFHPAPTTRQWMRAYV